MNKLQSIGLVIALYILLTILALIAGHLEVEISHFRAALIVALSVLSTALIVGGAK